MITNRYTYLDCIPLITLNKLRPKPINDKNVDNKSQYIIMSAKHPPQPNRFQIYTELSDGSGFTIKTSSFVFKFDRYGGWYDEYANYYNSDGTPEDPPSDSEDYHSEEEHSDHYPQEEDEFQKQFGGSNNYVEDEEQPESPYLAKIAKNIAILNSYPAGQPFRVNFKNLPYLSRRKEVYEYFKGKSAGVLNVVFSENDKRQFNGSGYFIVEDASSGETLFRLQGDKYGNREVSFYIDDVEEFLLDPISNQELYPDFLSKKSLKSYVNKGHAKVEEKPETQKQSAKKEKTQPPKTEVKAEVQKEKKAESAAKAAKVDNLQEFASYIFERKAFPKKSSFNEWIQANNFSHQTDVKAVAKIEGDDTRAQVTMKRKVFSALNGKACNQVPINFHPVQS